MLSSWIFAGRHVNLPPMRGEAPIQLRETVADHTKKEKKKKGKSLHRMEIEFQCQTPFKQINFEHQHILGALDEGGNLGHDYDKAKNKVRFERNC